MNQEKEELLDATAAAKTLRPRAKAAQVWRWMRKGVLCGDGSRIRLAHLRLGRRLFTTRADLAAFGRAVAEGDLRGLDTATTVNDRRVAAAEKALTEAGGA